MEGAWAVVHDLFEIIGGLAAAIAVGFSVWITTRERADRKQAEQDRDEARAAQRRAERAERVREEEAQARRVVVTFANPHSRVPQSPGLAASLQCHNYSDMPIVNVALYVAGKERPIAYRTVLHPAENLECEVDLDLDRQALADYSARFIDANGVPWLRRADTRLARVTR